VNVWIFCVSLKENVKAVLDYYTLPFHFMHSSKSNFNISLREPSRGVKDFSITLLLEG
jgi:hypothetical protein